MTSRHIAPLFGAMALWAASAAAGSATPAIATPSPAPLPLPAATLKGGLLVLPHAGTLAPATVLSNYATALAAVDRPKNVAFEFTVEQYGPRNLEQSHRVYRSGLNERDETIAVDGYQLTSPSVRIFHNRINRYDVTALAPKAADYDFTYAGVTKSGARVAYVFHTKAHSLADYAVSQVMIDGVHFLPLSMTFSLAGGGLRAHGVSRFAPQDAYWLIRDIAVDGKTGGSGAREHITFSKYSFPELPASAFSTRRAVATPEPALEGESP